MSKKTRTVILFLIGYTIALLVGFRSGEVYNRMKNRVMVEKVEMPAEPTRVVNRYYAVEISRGNDASYSEFSENDVLIKIFNNEKLRPLLKLKNIQIYNKDGERLY